MINCETLMGKPVPDTEQNAAICICPDCPTYQKSNLTGILYCAKGKSVESVVDLTCICSNCPVAKQHGLTQLYYCMQGKSADLK
ncbi:MAG: DUF2769 domain-containing protein [Candidatus Bathyarchaeia archaeon]|jgi:hypothetical protein